MVDVALGQCSLDELTRLDVLIMQQDTYSTETKVQDEEGKKSEKGPPSLLVDQSPS